MSHRGDGMVLVVACCHDIEVDLQKLWFVWDVNASEYFNEKTHPGKFDKSLDSNDPNNLTKRERETLYYLIRYYNQKEIATILNLSPRTVETYINSLKEKFNVTQKRELITTAIQKGYAMPIQELFDLALHKGLIKPL